MKIFSEDWVEAFGKAINDNPNYRPSALTWEGDMLFVITPSGNLDHEVRVLVGLYHGECTGTKLVKEGEETEAEFVITGNYDNVLQVIKNEIDPIRAIMAGKLKLEGNMAKVMRHTKAAQEIVVSLGNIETEFL
ncbi:MAG: SCP2 sterol-binding domain-containing protein [Candidatus Hodarchaeota archaeon]